MLRRPAPPVSPPVSEVMSTDILTVRPDTSLVGFIRLLEEHGISGAPVRDESGEIVGVVSYRDVVRATRATAREALDDPEVREEELSRAALEGHVVRDVMSRSIRKVSADTPVRDVARYLATRRVHRALVFEGDRLVGIVTAFDLLGVLAGRK